MKTIKEILLYIWQLPQNLLGLIMLLFMKPYISKEKYKGITYVVSKKMSGGISLGNYVILSSSYKDKIQSQKTWDHEWGHTRDSRIFGPLYLLVIGLPSIIWAWMYGTVIPYSHNGYYKFYTEKRADRLGGVNRNPITNSNKENANESNKNTDDKKPVEKHPVSINFNIANADGAKIQILKNGTSLSSYTNINLTGSEVFTVVASGVFNKTLKIFWGGNPAQIWNKYKEEKIIEINGGNSLTITMPSKSELDSLSGTQGTFVIIIQ